jgi:ATP-dependent HslUV protease ATP-binding subunit HslU
VRRALEKLTLEYESSGLDIEWMEDQAIERASASGIIFLDEIDKLIGVASQQGPDVSRGGVQRDLLPVVEGCRVDTTFGPVDTTHVLFIAAGAFHRHAPSELMPELQGRFPVRVELQPLGRADYRAILGHGSGGLLAQHVELLAVEGLEVVVSDDALDELARVADEANRRLDDIGARRLHTVLERVFEELSFVAPDLRNRRIVVDHAYVSERMRGVLEDEDLLRYIL